MTEFEEPRGERKWRIKAVNDQIAEQETWISYSESVLEKLQNELHKLKLRRVFLEYGVEVGSLVKHKDKIYKVSKIRVISNGKPWLMGRMRTKAGLWSKQENHLFTNWELVND